MSGVIAFVDILVDTKQLDSVISSLKQLPNLKELYEVVGSGCNVVSLVSARDIDELRDILLNRILKIDGVKETKTSMSLASYKLAELRIPVSSSEGHTGKD